MAVALAALAWRGHSRASASAAEAQRLQQALAQARTDLSQAREHADALAAQAVDLDTRLGAAKVRATAVEARGLEHDRELAVARTALDERRERESALVAELESLRRQAAQSSDRTADEPLRRRVAELESQLAALLARALAEPTETQADASAAAFQVVRVGAQGDFVVLDYGASHGAAPGQIATLARGTSPVAQVQISDVRARHSVAQVLPASRKGQLQTGDIVLLAR
ncbi:MAG: hypothetical protein C0502_09900 [Opitutus sp.]|nr:hypothetical protein [Opitutus sp.]